jgi:hypothetical protein
VNKRGDHLEGYDYPTTVPPSFATKTGVHVTTPFGAITGDVKGKPLRLLVPTDKCLKGEAGCTPVPPSPPTVRHFQCYPFVNTKGAGKSASGVTTDDQFGMLGPFKVAGSLELCASVNKNNEDPGAVTSPTFLVCYPGTPRFGSADVDLANQFATLDTIIDNYDDLCVSATLP